MQPEAEQAAAELRRLNAEAEKLEAEAATLGAEASKLAAEKDKLEAESERLRRGTVNDAGMLVLAVFAACLGALQFANSVGWL